jgi:hypothetical protein
MKRNILIATGITVGLLSVFWVRGETTAPKADCVNVYVDFGTLSNETPDERCFAVSGKVKAIDLLSKTTLKIDYADFGKDLGKAVCAVNKLPKLKSCEDIDWKWTLFEKHGSNDLNVKSHWYPSQTGVSFIELKTGDSIGLVYANKEGKAKTPDDNNN